MFLFWCYNKRTKIDKVYCLGLHHFTNENTICLCRKGIYSFYDGVMFTSLRFHVKKSNLERVITLNSPWKDMHSVLYAFPPRVIFYGSSRNLMISATCCRVQKWENLPA